MDVNTDIKRTFVKDLLADVEKAEGATEVADALASTLPHIVVFLNELRAEMSEHEILRCDLAGISLSAVVEFLNSLAEIPCPRAARDRVVECLHGFETTCERAIMQNTPDVGVLH